VLDGNIPVKTVHRTGETVFYDNNFALRVDSMNSVYARKVVEFQKSTAAVNHSFSSVLTDELVPLYLHYPEAFNQKKSGTGSDCSPSDWQVLRNGYLTILSGATVMKNQVIRIMPTDPEFYFQDVTPFVKDIIQKYGENEWTSGVLANELHRHLGVFAIIGVKMGIRAREYFDTGVDEFRALSHAGSVPPLSCMNDGLQVSTGATPGHGLLTVLNDSISMPVAEFTYMNNRIRLSLKPDIASKISKELKEINFVYGLDSNTYWELVRKNTLIYWKDLDRHDIFIIEKL
jgi:pyrimidine-specific ribonucleoside hydrolase